MGLIVVYTLWRAAKSVTAGVPGRFQTSIEMLVDMVEEQAKSIVPNEVSRRFVSPLALTVFLWILLMNRSEEHTSELQSLMRTSYDVFSLKKKKSNILDTVI